MTPDTKGAEALLQELRANLVAGPGIPAVKDHKSLAVMVDYILEKLRTPTDEAEGRVEYRVLWSDGYTESVPPTDSLEACQDYLSDVSPPSDVTAFVQSRRVGEWVTLPDTEEGP